MSIGLPDFILAAYPPSEKALLRRLKPRIMPYMLEHVSKADYSSDIAENLTVLEDILQTEVLPSRLRWHPKEVLELTRWDEPEDPKRSGYRGEIGHLIRLFSCCILLMAGGDPANHDYIDGENQTLAQAIESSRALGREFEADLGRLLTWRAAAIPNYDSFGPFVVFAFLVIASDDQGLTPIESSQLISLIESLSGYFEDPENEHIFHSKRYRHSLLRFDIHNQMHRKWLGYALKLKDDLSDHTDVQLYTSKMLFDA